MTTPTPLGCEVLLQELRDLHRQALLQLQVAREQLDDAGELRQADDPLARQVGDVRDAVEGQQVVHAQRVKRDVAHDDELVVAGVVGERRQRERLLRQQLRERGGDAARRVAQAGLADVAAERDEQAADGVLRRAQVDAFGRRRRLGMKRGDAVDNAHGDVSVAEACASYAGGSQSAKRPSCTMTSPSAVRRPPGRRSQMRSQCSADSFLPPVSGYERPSARWTVPPIFSSNSVAPIARSMPKFVPMPISPRRRAPSSVCSARCR